MTDPSTADPTWADLFERAGEYDVAVGELREALARRRDATGGEE